MKRASLALGAIGGFLLLLAGCNGLNLGFDMAGQGVDVAGQVSYVDGSPAAVAIMLQDKMKRNGMEAVILPGGDVVQCKTAAGLTFALILKSDRGADGRECTRVAVEWSDSRKDQQLIVQLFADVNPQAAQKK